MMDLSTRWEEREGRAVCVGEAFCPRGQLLASVRFEAPHSLQLVGTPNFADLRVEAEWFVKRAVLAYAERR